MFSSFSFILISIYVSHCFSYLLNSDGVDNLHYEFTYSEHIVAISWTHDWAMDEPGRMNLGHRAVTASLLLILEGFVGSESEGWAFWGKTPVFNFSGGHSWHLGVCRCLCDDVLGELNMQITVHPCYPNYIFIKFINIAPRKETQGHTHQRTTPAVSPWSPACVVRVVDPRLAIHSTATTSQVSPGLSQAVDGIAQPGRLMKQIWRLMGSLWVVSGVYIYIYVCVV